MVKRRRPSDAFVNGVPVEAPSANLGNPLLELPSALIEDIASRAVGLGVGGALSLTCRAFSRTNLLHAPALHIKLDDQRCDQLLTPRVVAALKARTCKLALTLKELRAQRSRQYIMLLTNVLKKLASCTAVEACKLGNTLGPPFSPLMPLGCSPDLAQRLMDSFPGLTSLSLHNYSIPCTDLASLLAHPQLSLQLQQLDLSSTIITQPKRPEPGAATLANLFHASRLKQLSLLLDNMTGVDRPLLPNLQPLAQHLTRMCLTLKKGVGLDEFTSALQPLAQLQVLMVSSPRHLEGVPAEQLAWDLGWLPALLQALPQLHTLQLPDSGFSGQVELDALLAATQLTSIQLHSLQRLTSSCADVPCSWQRLELTDSVDCATAAYLPLHTLTQPLVLGRLSIRIDEGDNCALVAAAIHNLTQACRVPVRIKELRLNLSEVDTAAEQREELQQLVAVLQAMKHCSWEMVCVARMNVGAADVATLAPLCLGCTQLGFAYGSLTPSLEFWHQLVQRMPTVTDVVFMNVEGSTSLAMHESLQLMVDQPWARWLHIGISPLSCLPQLPACWLAENLSRPGKVRVWFKA